MATDTSTSGGFLQGSLLSPPASSHASTPAEAILPHPRGTPLKPGGSKESGLIRYADDSILQIQRRFAKRDVAKDQVVEEPRPGLVDQALKDEMVQGYQNFAEAAKDIESLFNVIWISGTPSIQIPYLLNLALMVATFLPELSPSPRPMFRLISKLDVAFASLIQGHNIETGELLPGFGMRAVSGTEKVRLKSITERTRVCVVDVFNRTDMESEQLSETDDDDSDELMLADDTEQEALNASNIRESQGDWDMHIAKVYDRTVVELGDVLGPTIND